MNESLFQALFEEIEARPLTVTELNTEIKSVVESGLPTVWVEGEIVSFRRTGPGHRYFSLNDGTSQIKAVIWKSANPRIRFDPQDGMNVQIRGRLSYWAQKGELKLQVDTMQPAGEGSLAIAFEQIRLRLESEGLFAAQLKRQLPRFPRRVGVVTSATGAAFADIVHVLSRRAASVDIVLFPAVVQGDGAADEICSAIDLANRLNVPNDPIDVLIVGRGGGAAEDLWAFNDECLARAIRSSAIPIISAVGHEIDTTIADLAADCRAATPSAAAEIVAQHEDEIRSLLNRSVTGLAQNLNYCLRAFDGSLCEASRRLHAAFGSGHAADVMRFEGAAKRLSYDLLDRHLEGCSSRVSELEKRAWAAGRAKSEKSGAALERSMLRLDALSPLRVLERGYSITQRADGSVVKTTSSVAVGDTLKIRLTDGKLDATVRAVE